MTHYSDVMENLSQQIEKRWNRSTCEVDDDESIELITIDCKFFKSITQFSNQSVCTLLLYVYVI